MKGVQSRELWSCQFLAGNRFSFRLFLGLVLAVAISTPAQAAWGPDGNSPFSCTGTTRKTATIYDTRSGSAIIAGQVQLRGSSCYYGVNWTRNCAKLWYEPSYALINRYFASQDPPGTQDYSNYSLLYSNSECTGYVAFRTTPVVFNNCAAASMGTCSAYGLGQIFQSGTFIGEGSTSAV
jgi:hypothetical protein